METTPTYISSTSSSIIQYVQQRLGQAEARSLPIDRPFVTLSYAQTLDGSIALKPGQRLHISNAQSYAFTHQLRAMHQAILVGIGTVLADDPRLTVRLVDGQNPQVVILDSRLRCPLPARLWQNTSQPPWFITSYHAGSHRQVELEALGAKVFRLDTDADGKIDLVQMLRLLAKQGVKHIMVEGGRQVITSFIKAKLIDQVVLTLGPMFAGGIRAVDNLGFQTGGEMSRLKNVHVDTLDNDIIIRGDLVWQQS